MKPTLFITGTDTGVGKTVLATLLAREIRQRGVAVAALKPLCSGGRADAHALHAALGGSLPLDEINPWHFRAPIAPVLAARREGKAVRLGEVLAYVRRLRTRFEMLIVEGAGGLLSPLGEDFDNRDLIVRLHAAPVVVCPNRLGAVNQCRLAFAALPRAAARRAHAVLVAPARPDAASRSNLTLLADALGSERLHEFPWLGMTPVAPRPGVIRQARRLLNALLPDLVRSPVDLPRKAS
jgi:dethiobiotin synthetase